MKYLGIIFLLILGCQNKKVNDTNESVMTLDVSVIDKDKGFLDSLYTCYCDQFISKLEEIPNTDSNAYRITIQSIDGTWTKSELINTRPGMSRISYCNEFYTVVSFACGGPCHSELFVFTSDTRPDEQYDYTQIVNNNPNIISHIKNEEFEKLIFHNLNNNKEMKVNNPDIGLYNYGAMDSIIMKNENVILYYSTQAEKHKTKIINIRQIL